MRNKVTASAALLTESYCDVQFAHCLHLPCFSMQHHVCMHFALVTTRVPHCTLQMMDELATKHVFLRNELLWLMLDPSVFQFSLTSYLRAVKSVRRLVMGMKPRNTDRKVFELAQGTPSLGSVPILQQVWHTVASACEAVSLLT